MPTHILYIDDSGTKEYADAPEEYKSKRGKSRYFVFGGALLTPDCASLLSRAIIKLKLECFGTECVEIKSNWVRIDSERKRRYLKPHDISEERFKQFIDDYYAAIVDCDLIFIAAVIDKLHMQEEYPKNPWYPPAVAYDLLLQRVEKELKRVGDVSVIIDDMTGATPRGNQYKFNLTRQHQRMIQRGSALMSGFNFKLFNKALRFVNSAQSHLVQVADIAAYNVYRQFVDHGEEWETQGITELPTYPHLARIENKFRKDANGRVQGYGIVKFPLRKRIPWRVTG
jgi:hypothetical protein